MKVFISWSGALSKQLGEAIRDWLPAVIQLAEPYFTPSDIEKGSRWPTDIARELESSQIGILCITRDNLHADWMLFEAGALSKSLDKSHVCPIIFGITNTDLAGPLKQFQTTSFDKADVHKLIGVVNSRLGDRKLPMKTLDTVFEKWWPDLEKRVSEILANTIEPTTPVRSDRELIEEILLLNRAAARRTAGPSVSPKAIYELIEAHVNIHDSQASETGGYQEVLNLLQAARAPLEYLAAKYVGTSAKFDELVARLKTLTYQTDNPDEPVTDDDIPF